ncbi:MAG: hypothetical protein ABSA41_21190 [Terriglobia bacterium]|jgi:hypothetical protein
MTASDRLKEIRKKAQEAIDDMPEGELRTKAFEVILQHLLASESSHKSIEIAPAPAPAHFEGKQARKQPGSTKSRILLLKDEGFFAVPRSISEIKSELQAHGWILAMTSLSGPLQQLVQSRELRRIRGQGARQKVWKYVNP